MKSPTSVRSPVVRNDHFFRFRVWPLKGGRIFVNQRTSFCRCRPGWCAGLGLCKRTRRNRRYRRWRTAHLDRSTICVFSKRIFYPAPLFTLISKPNVCSSNIRGKRRQSPLRCKPLVRYRTATPGASARYQRERGSGKLSKHIDKADLKIEGAQEVMTIIDFALKYKLTSDEQLRLTKLFGMFATKQELLMNARTKSRIRH